MDVKRAPEIRRKQSIPPEDRTEERDAAAEYIEAEVIAEGRWPEMTMTDIAAETVWSRQHIANTLEAYFEPANRPQFDDIDFSGLEGVDEDVFAAYRAGYQQGHRDGYDAAMERIQQREDE